jgi:hypothetical protein
VLLATMETDLVFSALSATSAVNEFLNHANDNYDR